MTKRRQPAIVIFVGVGFLFAAALLRFVVVPMESKLPDDLEVSFRYEGTGTMLNPAALQNGGAGSLVLSDIPVVIDRHVYVSAADNDAVVAHDDITVTAEGAPPISSNHTYGVDRTTLDAAPPPHGVEVETHAGMTISFPLHPIADSNYALYDSATRSDVRADYKGTSTRAGREVLNYTATASGDLVDPAFLSSLPASLPKAQLASLAPALPLDVVAKLTPEVVAALPDPVPFRYSITTDYELAVDKTLGTPIDGSLNQQIVANVVADGTKAPLMPVFSLNAALTDQSVSDAAASASSASRILTLLSVVVPTVSALVGLVLIASGAATLVARHRRA